MKVEQLVINVMINIDYLMINNNVQKLNSKNVLKFQI